MKLRSVGTIIATRSLSLSSGKRVTVKIGKPRRFRGGNDDYYCPYQVVGIGDDGTRYAAGVDPIQALQLALRAIGTDLSTSKEAKAGDLSWEAGNKPSDFGFPEL